jgi:TolB-like protein
MGSCPGKPDGVCLKEKSFMPFIEIAEIKEREIFRGFKVRFVHSANITFAHWTIETGAILPQHSHPHEQVANVLEGSVRRAGDNVRVTGNVFAVAESGKLLFELPPEPAVRPTR